MLRNDGLDISNHQTPSEINWSLVPVYPLMAHKATEGKGFTDPYFEARFPLFRQRGHRWCGAYHWIRPDSSIRDQIDNLSRALGSVNFGQVGDFVQLDWEMTPISYSNPALGYQRGMTTDEIDNFIDLFQSRWGERLIVYSASWVTNFRTWRGANPSVALWYAAYPDPGQESSFRSMVEGFGSTIWQWTSTLRVPGITDGVDANEVLQTDVLNRISLRDSVPKPERPIWKDESVLVVKPPSAEADDPFPEHYAVFQQVGNEFWHIEAKMYFEVLVPAGAPTDAKTLPTVSWMTMRQFSVRVRPDAA